jgi:hypothetical protein
MQFANDRLLDAHFALRRDLSGLMTMTSVSEASVM